MGWFDEQIRQRKETDQEIFEDSIFEMASAVLGKRRGGSLNDRRIVTKAAIDEILKYYHFKPADMPDSLKDPGEQLEYALRPHGMMYRNVTLSDAWYREAYGPMIAYRKEDRMPVVLLPRAFYGYYCKNADGSKIIINRKTAELFEKDAICFYDQLPLRSIGISDLLAYLWNCLRISDYVWAAVLTFAVVLTGMMLPRIIRFLTGPVLDSGSSGILAGTAVFMICVLVSSQLLTISRTLAVNRLQIKTSLSVEAAMMMRLISLPVSFFKKYSSGELASRSGSINLLCGQLLANVFSLGLTAVVSLLYINQIFHFTPALGIPAMVIIVLTLGISLLSTRVQMQVTKEQMIRSAKESGVSFAIISGIQKIRLSGAEKRAFARWARTYAVSAKLLYNPPIFLRLNSVMILAVSLAGTAVMYFSAQRSGITPSDYMAFLAAYGAVSGAFTALADVASSVAQIRPILDMAEPILQAVPENSEERTMVTHLSGGIELSNIHFRYNEKMPYVIDGLSLKVRPGEYLGIVGTTGSGKSTLMRLMLGFEIPERGGVYFDGMDLQSLDLRSLRRKMGVVTQNGKLFLGSIYSNIIVSAPHLSMEEAWKAAETAGIAEDIRNMPMGMHTIIGEGTGGFSGGQKQRLMIARAVAPDPKILMFDEATGSLDNKTQKKVSEALDSLKCTRIVIAHRLSTIRNCDRILVLDKGKIVEEGDYESLIARNGIFADLVERQRIDV